MLKDPCKPREATACNDGPRNACTTGAVPSSSIESTIERARDALDNVALDAEIKMMERERPMEPDMSPRWQRGLAWFRELQQRRAAQCGNAERGWQIPQPSSDDVAAMDLEIKRMELEETLHPRPRLQHGLAWLRDLQRYRTAPRADAPRTDAPLTRAAAEILVALRQLPFASAAGEASNLATPTTNENNVSPHGPTNRSLSAYVRQVVREAFNLEVGAVPGSPEEQFREAIANRAAAEFASLVSTGLGSMPPRKEWDAARHDCGNTRETEGYESADYVDGWNAALDATGLWERQRPTNESEALDDPRDAPRISW